MIGNCEEAKVEATPLTAKNMRIGTEVTAKVYEVRARGLVLDLGNGIRGLYRFKVPNPSIILFADTSLLFPSLFSLLCIVLISVFV